MQKQLHFPLISQRFPFTSSHGDLRPPLQVLRGHPRFLALVSLRHRPGWLWLPAERLEVAHVHSLSAESAVLARAVVGGRACECGAAVALFRLVKFGLLGYLILVCSYT